VLGLDAGHLATHTVHAMEVGEILQQADDRQRRDAGA
jgi:hypothetical protein